MSASEGQPPAPGSQPAESAAAGQPAAAADAKKKRRRRARIEWLVLLTLTVLVTFGLRSFVVQSFRIPSGSMETTLHGGCEPHCTQDRILVNKLAYKLHGIGRGDIVVFKATGPWIAAIGGPGDVIKRVIGLPGDTVRCCDANGHVVVDGRSRSEPYVFVDGPDPRKEFGPITVPNGELWVMGDHRNDSSDSRFNGPIAISSVIGRAFMRIWPISRIGLL